MATNNYVLSKEYIDIFFDSYLYKRSVEKTLDTLEPDELKEIIYSALCWDSKVHLLCYFIMNCIRRRTLDNESINYNDCLNILGIVDEGYFEIEYFTEDFIEFILDYCRSDYDLNLQELLVELLDKYASRGY